jgi:DNA gyrase/topoisomerase IV subunit A
MGQNKVKQLMNSSQYINKERRDYSLYVLQSRAIPHAADGLKAGARRVLWVARDGKKYKSASLAGATMPIHPHASPDGAINTLAAPYGNNVPLLLGEGAFGTRLNPTAYGASRYTSVKVSEFTKDAVFCDIEIVPMQENYDGTLVEPKHFLPLIPIALLNPQEGIAVGFASSILPRDLSDIIKSQIAYLDGKDFYEELPAFTPTNQRAQDWIEDDEGNMTKFIFHGSHEKINATTVKVFNLPYGITHEKYINLLDKMEEQGKIIEYEDNSKDCYDITIRFKKGTLNRMDDEEVLKYLGLTCAVSENMTMIDFDGERVLKTTYGEFIQMFCDWRLQWYKIRYQRLADLLAIDIQKYIDILLAIKRNVGGFAKKVGSRAELKECLEEMGIVHIDYIADLPIYRFTEEERCKVEEKLKDATNLMKRYKTLLKSEDERRKVYIEELTQILKKRYNGV